MLLLLQPITLALVYVGTTLKDLSDVTHGWGEFSKTRWVRISLINGHSSPLLLSLMDIRFPNSIAKERPCGFNWKKYIQD